MNHTLIGLIILLGVIVMLGILLAVFFVGSLVSSEERQTEQDAQERTPDANR